jgi:DUF1680 family protein
MKEFNLKAIELQDVFWRNYQRVVRKETIPYQYQVLNDEIDVDVQAEREDPNLPAGKSHALANFRIAAGQMEGSHFGWFFQDSDVYKWIESAGYSLLNTSNPQLEEIVDEVVELVEAAQEEDGYLNTFFQLTRPKLKYRQLYFSHELYCAGHLVEAAIAYDQATGKDKLLRVAEKNIANICAHFGRDPEKIQGADGHQEIELALVRLYEYTDKQTYLTLADFFLEVRGEDPAFYQKEILRNQADGLSDETPKVDLTYLQAYDQPKKQHEAKGHAVRMLYMASGMAKVAQHTQNQELIVACQEIWEDIVCKKMYVTGGVGSTVHGEAFVGPYDLPNDTMYCETCAAIALVQFSFEMFKLTKQQKYLDSLERALYNSVLSGAAIDGKHFFYVNPLEVNPRRDQENPGKGHVKAQRPDWLGCACCPPNFARLISSIQRFVYAWDQENLYVNLFVASRLEEPHQFMFEQKSGFPFSDDLTICYQGVPKTLVIHKPKGLSNFQISSEHEWQETKETIIFEAVENLTAKINFEQPIQLLRGNPQIIQDINQVAVQRGPFVYCLEEADNGQTLWRCRIDPKTLDLDFTKDDTLLPTTLHLAIKGYQSKEWSGTNLYEEKTETVTSHTWQLIPYHLWGNRGVGEMRVWLPLLVKE